MDFFQAQHLFQELFPGKEIKFEFDPMCQNEHHIGYTYGVLNLMHQVECNKVKISIEGQNPIYVPIEPHKLNVPWSTIKSILDLKQDVHIEDSALQQASEDTTGQVVQNLSDFSGLSMEAVQKRVDDWKSRQEKKEEAPTS